ncbi:MAG: tripartite tricarboxylate transporter substrate-binding protein [Burkholderiaceae bacterium]
MKRISHTRRGLCGLAMAMAALASPLGHAQDNAESYPNKPIRMLMAQSPGGAPDILARTLSEQLSKRLGVSIIMEYKPSAGGVIAQNMTANSPADGYTILFATPSMLAATPYLNKSLPFDPFKDFQPITIIGESANILVTSSKVQANSVAELIAQAKADPGAIRYASSGLGTPSHLAGELLSAKTGAQMLHVPYKGAGQALNDLVGGTVDFMVTSPAAAKSYLSSGHLKALATTGRVPDPLLPKLPLMSATVPGYEITQWWGLAVRAGTPEAIVNKIHTAVVESLKDPKILQAFSQLGVTARSMSVSEFSNFIDSERSRYQELIKLAKINVEH